MGVLLFALGTGGRDVERNEREAPPEIVVTGADLGRLRSEWEQEHGRLPTAAEEAALVQEMIDEEVLHREALALGLDRNDRVVRSRLVQQARFLTDDPAGDDAALEAEGRALGLERSDLVIRRYLVQAMRLLAAKARASDFPSDDALAAYFESRRQDYAEPARVRLTHVYLSRDRRGASAERDAMELLKALRRDGTRPEAAAAMADGFVRGAHIGPMSSADLDRTFGPAFARAIDGVEVNTWAGPVRSSYGFHLVWLHERISGGLLPLDAVRNRVAHRFLREKRQERLRAHIAALRQRYIIRVDRARAG
jgi:hypothetical protein